MGMMPIKPERKAQLEDYARRYGQDAVAALDEVLAKYLTWERQDYDDTVEAVKEAYEDGKAARTQPAEEVLKSYA